MTRRVRRRVEGAAVLLAFPLAVGLTAVAIAPSASSPRSSLASGGGRGVTAGDGLSVSLAGSDPVAAYAVADKLSAEGYRLAAVSAAIDKSLSSSTIVVYYERERRAAATRLRDVLGTGTIRLDHVLEPSSDLTVLLGKDPQRT